MNEIILNGNELSSWSITPTADIPPRLRGAVLGADFMPRPAKRLSNKQRRKLAEAKQEPLPLEEQKRRHLARLAREEQMNAHVVVQYAQNGGPPLTRDQLLTGEKEPRIIGGHGFIKFDGAK